MSCSFYPFSVGERNIQRFYIIHSSFRIVCPNFVSPFRSTQSVKITRHFEDEYHRVFSSKFGNNDTHSRQSKLRMRSIPCLSGASANEEVSLSIQQELPDVFTPRLPPELWLQIFTCAARDERDVTITGSHYTRSHSFLEAVPAHTHLPERLARYNSWLRWKASLTTVCSLFNAIAQEVLYEDVWITGSKDGRKLAERLGGSADTKMIGTSRAVEKKASKQKQKPWSRFVGSKTKAKQISIATSSHSPPVRRPSYSSFHDLQKQDPGCFIRRLRIETYAMDQCSPHDLLLILQHCPGLLIFEDCRSIRRPMHPLIITGSDVAPFDTDPDVIGDKQPTTPLLTTDILAQTILSRPLKRVTWTNYAHDGGNFDRGVRVYVQALGPLLEKAGSDLEVLEIITSAGGMSMGSMESESSWVIGSPAGSHTLSQGSTLGGPGPTVKSEPESMITRQFLLMAPGLSTRMTDFRLSSNPSEPSITLPSLESLKVTLDNATFAVLSTWSMPSLRNLSVVSPDFKFGLEGFRRFLEVHGDRIQQLELGHSNSEVEEFWVTEQSREFRPRSRIRLDVWCPNLKEFICNADAEWNWENPDWIAPHLLLPAHPGLEFIGVRGLEKRFVNDAAEFVRTSSTEEYPYFMLLQQFSSMLRVEAFPSLRCVRDLSWQSDKIRRTGRLHPRSTTSTDPGRLSSTRPLVSSPSFPFLRTNRLLTSRPRASEKNVLSSSHVLRFWDEALEKCRRRGVSVENFLGIAVTGYRVQVGEE